MAREVEIGRDGRCEKRRQRGQEMSAHLLQGIAAGELVRLAAVLSQLVDRHRDR
jgi:hypothetical protein